MGDFDRKTTSDTPGQSKQVAMAIVLGVTLIGVLGYHFMKKGPQPAQATSFGGGGAVFPLPSPDETPEQATNALRNDPTAALLRQTSIADASLDQMPRNPFVMTEDWRASLTITPEVTRSTPSTLETPRIYIPPTSTKIVPKSVKAEDFKFNGTIQRDGSLEAFINNRVVKVGMVVGEARVVDIQENRVTLQHIDFPEGPKTELIKR